MIRFDKDGKVDRTWHAHDVEFELADALDICVAALRDIDANVYAARKARETLRQIGALPEEK